MVRALKIRPVDLGVSERGVVGFVSASQFAVIFKDGGYDYRTNRRLYFFKCVCMHVHV